MDIFIDTSAFYNLVDVGERHHSAARELYQAHVRDSRFYTSDLVMAETWLLIRGRLGRHAASAWWAGLRSGIVEIAAAHPVDLEAAWRIAQRYADQDFSLVDCVSFAIMERLGIETAFAYDRHFGVVRFGAQSERRFQLLSEA